MYSPHYKKRQIGTKERKKERKEGSMMQNRRFENKTQTGEEKEEEAEIGFSPTPPGMKFRVWVLSFLSGYKFSHLGKNCCTSV
jgi:hypothetical protein